MKMLTLTTAAAAAAALAACAADDMDDRYDPVGAPGAGIADAEVRGPQGRLLARATASDGVDGVRIRVEAEGLAPGTYAVHVHQTGRCDPPGFESAGGHWNPTSRSHGTLDPQGPHKGDLPNLQVGQAGQGSMEYSIPDVSVEGGPYPMLDEDGAAVVIHAGADDYRTDPSGNSGARIGCGVLRG